MSSQSSLLHQAVALAQAGQREQARHLLWQFIQSSPDHEVAWLWLASVAADQAEYVRALNEVLRINPQNPQARQLLDEFQRQYGAQSPPGGYTPPAAGPSTPPPSSYSTQSPPPQSPPPSPLPQSQPYSGPAQSAGSPPPGQQGFGLPPASPERVIERERVVERRGRGCGGGCMPGLGCLGCGGCGPSCLLVLVVVILLPVLACAGLSYTTMSLRGLDLFAAALPGRFGTKTIRFETDKYEVKLEVPRSWVLVSEDNDDWLFYRDLLDQAVAYDDPTRTWEQLETNANPNQRVIVDVNPLFLAINGGEIVFTQANTKNGDFSCDAVRAQADQNEDYEAVYEYDGGLCGYRQSTVLTASDTTRIFEGVDPPEKVWRVTLVTPVDEGTGLVWTFNVNTELQDWYDGRLDRLGKSVKVNKK